METPNPFSARTSARGVLPQAMGESLHVGIHGREHPLKVQCSPTDNRLFVLAH